MLVSRAACPIILGLLLTASSGFGEEPRRAKAVDDLSIPGARAALGESIPRREKDLARRQRKDVLAEVGKRALEMGVSASVEELTDLLGQRAHLEIELDKCRLGTGGTCGIHEAALARVEAAFREKTGVSTREFRGGRKDEAGREARLQGLFEASGNETCTCAFNVYSSNRWMNPWWGLECNNHGSHGVCSNDVDSAHSPGSGAMTGDVDLYFGANHANRDCPDDHFTCFRGPSTDNSGAWGNTCSCDTWHSQYYDPYSSWYGGDLTDSLEVAQLYTNWMSVGGPCNAAWVTVGEYIKENDPWCCDDPMGTLWVSLPLQDGPGTVSGQASAQNCNGGSQSGVYPYCGTFGATIRVGFSCSTYVPPPPDPNTCQGYCFNTPPDATCSCQLGCSFTGDCCPDYQSLCCDPYPQWNGCN